MGAVLQPPKALRNPGEPSAFDAPASVVKKLPRLAASQSFTLEEVSWLEQLIKILLRGGDARIVMRAPEARGMLHKIQVMKERIETVKKERGML